MKTAPYPESRPTDDVRTAPRVDYDASAALRRANGDVVAAHTVNLSFGGVALRDVELATGEEVSVELALMAGAERHALPARVIWRKGREAGLVFIDLRRRDRMAVEAAVLARKQIR